MPNAHESIEHVLLGYRSTLDQPPDDLDPWERRHLPSLADLAESALEHVDGDSLCRLGLTVAQHVRRKLLR